MAQIRTGQVYSNPNWKEEYLRRFNEELLRRRQPPIPSKDIQRRLPESQSLREAQRRPDWIPPASGPEARRWIGPSHGPPTGPASFQPQRREPNPLTPFPFNRGSLVEGGSAPYRPQYAPPSTQPSRRGDPRASPVLGRQFFPQMDANAQGGRDQTPETLRHSAVTGSNFVGPGLDQAPDFLEQLINALGSGGQERWAQLMQENPQQPNPLAAFLAGAGRVRQGEQGGVPGIHFPVTENAPAPPSQVQRRHPYLDRQGLRRPRTRIQHSIGNADRIPDLSSWNR